MQRINRKNLEEVLKLIDNLKLTDPASERDRLKALSLIGQVVASEKVIPSTDWPRASVVRPSQAETVVAAGI